MNIFSNWAPHKLESYSLGTKIIILVFCGVEEEQTNRINSLAPKR